MILALYIYRIWNPNTNIKYISVSHSSTTWKLRHYSVSGTCTDQRFRRSISSSKTLYMGWSRSQARTYTDKERYMNTK